MNLLYQIGHWFSTGSGDAWRWVCSLNEEEWLLLLAITSIAGFMCMRGFGSRSKY